MSFSSTSRKLRHVMLLASLGLGLGLTAAPALAADPAPAAGAAAPAPEMMRAEFGPLVKAFEEMMKAKDFKGALAKLKEMDAMENKTPVELFGIERMRVSAASAAGDNEQTIKSLEITLASGRLSATEVPLFMQTLAGLRFQTKDYAKAVSSIEAYFKAGGNDPKMRYLYIQSLYNGKEYQRTITELRTEIKTEEAAGKSPSEDYLKIMLNSFVSLNDKSGYVEAMQLLAKHYPRKEYWEDLLNRYFSSTANSERWVLHFYRLKSHMSMLSDPAEIADMAEMLLRAGQPAEAKKVMEQGFSAGVMGKGNDAKKHGALRDKANKAANDDLKTLEQAEASAGKAKEGTGLVNLGYALVLNGKTDKGLALMEQGLKLPVKKMDEARMLTGIAYTIAGRKEEATKTFGNVTAADGGTELAKYWVMHISKPMLQ